MNRKYNFIFWVIIVIVLLISFGIQSRNFIYTFYFLTFFVPIVITTSWILNSILIPRYLMKKRYSKFFLYSFYVLIISLDIELLIVFVAFLLISFYDYENMPSIIDSYKWIPIVMYLIVMISAFTNLTSQLLKSQGPTIGGANEDPETIQVRSERKNRIIKLNQISYVESMSDYIIIFMEGEGRIITRERISRLFEKLPGYFIRIHRSYLINKNFIDSYSKDAVIVGGKELPISRTYKKEFFLYLENQDNN